mmetsp:Transcript_35627/g.112366  ORF Transcript_35627/g.112366 Transcript_35627/m.112366 type:complete len:138 (-) Transcript_35627:217-630(-)
MVRALLSTHSASETKMPVNLKKSISLSDLAAITRSPALQKVTHMPIFATASMTARNMLSTCVAAENMIPLMDCPLEEAAKSKKIMGGKSIQLLDDINSSITPCGGRRLTTGPSTGPNFTPMANAWHGVLKARASMPN